MNSTKYDLLKSIPNNSKISLYFKTRAYYKNFKIEIFCFFAHKKAFKSASAKSKTHVILACLYLSAYVRLIYVGEMNFVFL